MPLRGQTITPAFLRAAGSIENFRVGSLPGENTVAVVCKSPSDSDWRLVWKYTDVQSVDVGGLTNLFKRLKRHCGQLYIVEHILLRFGRSGHHDPQRKFAFSFTITAVVSTPPHANNDEEYKTIVRDVIRQNTPSHIVVEYCFLRSHQLRRFESLYWEWRSALRHRIRSEIISTSDHLRDFLRRCGRE
jgi:hypothetical protein